MDSFTLNVRAYQWLGFIDQELFDQFDQIQKVTVEIYRLTSHLPSATIVWNRPGVYRPDNTQRQTLHVSFKSWIVEDLNRDLTVVPDEIMQGLQKEEE